MRVAIAVGVRVRIDGLNSMPQYNGTEGDIVEWDVKNERWKVTLDYDKTTKAIRNKNLTPIGKVGDSQNKNNTE